MPEQLDLTAPIVPPSRTTYAIRRITLDWNAQVIQVVLGGSDGVEVLAEYTGPTASTLMMTLNTANLSTISLNKRILNKLVLDGKLPSGTVSGTP